jgi:hypothetical protein
MAVASQVSVFFSYVMQDNEFVKTIPPEQYLVTMKTETTFPYEMLEEIYCPLRRKYPGGYHLRLATFGNGLGCDPSSGH